MTPTALFLSFNLLIFFALGSSYSVDDNLLDNHSNNPVPIIILHGAIYPYGHGDNLQAQGKHQVESHSGRCNSLNLGVCANLLGLANIEIGNVPTKPCCSLIQGLVELEAAVCLCTAIRANILGIIDINLPISLRILFNNCGMKPSAEYQCSP